MPYAHSWGAPHVAMLPNHRVAVPRQVCTRCATSRNPITREIAFYGRGYVCWTNAVPAPGPDYEDALRRLQGDLESLEASGTKVDRYHAAPQPRRPVRDLGNG